MAAALCYFGMAITGVLFLVWAPYNQSRIIRFHAFQSIFLTVAYMVISMALSLLASVILPWGVVFTLHNFLRLALLVVWILAMWKAYNREKFVIPVLGEFAEKQA